MTEPLREKIARELHTGHRDPIVEFALSRGMKTEEEVATQRPPWDGESEPMKAQYRALADRILAIPEIEKALVCLAELREYRPLTPPSHSISTNPPK